MIKLSTLLKNGLLALSLLLLIQLSTAQNYRVQANFNDSLLPPAWTNNAISGTQSFSFGSDASTNDAGNNNIDGTALVYFDDDALGSTSTNNTAELITPVFDNSGDTLSFLEFDYNFREVVNAVSDSFTVDVFDGVQWQRVLSRGTDDCGSWVLPPCRQGLPHAFIDISAYKNTQCQVRFRYHDGNDWAWYLGIDNVEIYEPLINELELVSIDSLRDGCTNSTANNLAVSIRNNGGNSLSNFNVSYSVNGSTPITETVTTTLNPNSSMGYVFSTALNTSAGTNNIIAYTDLTNDVDRSNDTNRIQLYRSAYQNLPFTDDFETPNQLWQIHGQNSSWQRGVPSGNLISTAASGQNAFVTNLSGNHNSNEISYLESPCFDLTNVANPLILSFKLNYRLENNVDKISIEYTTDGGNSYTPLGPHPNFIGQNWHSSQLPFWSGNTNGNWIRMTTLIDSINQASDISFRFVFRSDLNLNYEGVAIDDFQLIEQDSLDISISRIISPVAENNSDTFYCQTNNLSKIRFELQNIGYQTLDTIYCDYLFNNNVNLRDTIIRYVNTNETVELTSNISFDFSQNQSNHFRLICSVNSSVLTADDTIFSDTILTNPQNQNYSVPFIEDFDEELKGLTPITYPKWINYSGNFISNPAFKWELTGGRSAPIAAGPVSDYNIRSFQMTTGTFGANGFEANLVSPCIYIDSSLPDPTLKYAYQRYASNASSMGPLYIDIYNGSWQCIDTISGITHSSTYQVYSTASESLMAFKNQNIRIRFRAENRGTQSNTGIDLIRIYPNSLDENIANEVHDAFPIKYTNSPWECADSIPISMSIYNYLDTVILPNSLPLRYEVYGSQNTLIYQSPIEYNTDTIFTIDTTLIISSEYIHEFSNKLYIPQGGNYRITTSILINDINSKDDTASYYIGKSSSVLPFFENFDDPLYYYRDQYRCELWSDLFKYNWDFGGGRFYVNDTNYCGNLYKPYSGSGFLKGRFSTTTPCIDLSGHQNIDLEFYFQLGALPQNAKFYIYVIDLSLTSTNRILVDSIPHTQRQTSFLAPYLKKTVSLDNYAGKNIRIVLENQSYSTGLIDDIHVFDPTITSISKLQPHTHSLSVYPNPNNGQFTIEVPEELIGERYEIIDLSGKVLKNSNFKWSTENIQIEADKGVYILRVPGMGINQKVVVN